MEKSSDTNLSIEERVHQRKVLLNVDISKDEGQGNREATKELTPMYLTIDQVSHQYKEQFILSGYRRPYSTAQECFLSLFELQSNESLNIWTHLIPLFAFILRFARVIAGLSLADPYNYPLICFALCICCFCSMSCGAHMFNCMSPRLRDICFFFDYAAIATYCFGASQAFYFYGRPAYTEVAIYKHHLLFLGIGAMISLTANFLCCASRHRWLSIKYLIRTTPFVFVFLYIISPIVWRTYTCVEATDCNFDSLTYHKRHTLFYLFAAIFNISRFPERLKPGTFDCFGNSHNFLHVFTALGASDEFSAIHSDMINRRNILHHLQGPTFLNCVVFMIVFAILNIAVVLYFARQLKPDKEESKCGIAQ